MDHPPFIEHFPLPSCLKKFDYSRVTTSIGYGALIHIDSQSESMFNWWYAWNLNWPMWGYEIPCFGWVGVKVWKQIIVTSFETPRFFNASIIQATCAKLHVWAISTSDEMPSCYNHGVFEFLNSAPHPCPPSTTRHRKVGQLLGLVIFLMEWSSPLECLERLVIPRFCHMLVEVFWWLEARFQIFPDILLFPPPCDKYPPVSSLISIPCPTHVRPLCCQVIILDEADSMTQAAQQVGGTGMTDGFWSPTDRSFRRFQVSGWFLAHETSFSDSERLAGCIFSSIPFTSNVTRMSVFFSNNPRRLRILRILQYQSFFTMRPECADAIPISDECLKILNLSWSHWTLEVLGGLQLHIERLKRIRTVLSVAMDPLNGWSLWDYLLGM